MDTDVLLEAHKLHKCYLRGRSLAPKSRVRALQNVDLKIPVRARVALVGRSGSGKSTLGRCLVSLEQPDSGEVWFQGRDLLQLRGAQLKAVRRDIQMLFQHSATAINPAFPAVEAVAEPLRIQQITNREECRRRALELMNRVGIPPAWAERSPLEFSGGQRQRLALARALILEPKLLILDEALSGLDVSTQARMANMLLELQCSFSLSYLFITHDLRLAAFLADTVVVMQEGKIVEAGSARELFSAPQSEATVELIKSIPPQPNAGWELAGSGV